MTEYSVHLLQLIDESYEILDRAIQEHVFADDRTLAGICILFSGGNDSTVLTHLFRNDADYAAHINTGIGVEDTRTYVRTLCAEWDLPLIEKHPPPGSTYRELVLDQGFPGPGHHWKMYQRLKERGLRQVRKEIVKRPRKERVVFLAGRRRDESQRRMNLPECDRVGSTVFVSPLVNWTKADMIEYRSYHPEIPRNEVSDNLHMSGECLCGAFAKQNELDEIAFFYPEVAREIEQLEADVLATGKFPPERCEWGWGHGKGMSNVRKAGLLCSTCDANYEQMQEAA